MYRSGLELGLWARERRERKFEQGIRKTKGEKGAAFGMVLGVGGEREKEQE